LKGIVDTGTSAIVGPKEIIDEMTKIFPKTINCTEIDQFPSLKFVIGGDTYEVSP
jgi:hypothetical protein